MSSPSKIARRSQAARGGLTTAAGRITGSRHLRAKGRRLKARAGLRRAGVKIKDVFRR